MSYRAWMLTAFLMSSLLPPSMTAAEPEDYLRLPVYFTQSHTGPGFVLHGVDGSACFLPDGITFRLRQQDEAMLDGSAIPFRRAWAGDTLFGPNNLHLSFVDARPNLVVEGRDELPGKVNYLIGNKPEQWHTGIPTYASVVYRDVWPGIDITYRGESGLLKYDIEVRPGADISDIRMRWDGADIVRIDENGDLVIHSQGRLLREAKPGMYQEKDGERVWLSGGFALEGNTVGFKVEEYDPALPLVIDPASDLVWSTFLGGTGDDSCTAGLVVDSAGAVYVAGYTSSTDFPVTSGAFDTSHNGGYSDVFVTKLNSTGSGLVYSTFVGGSGSEGAYGIALGPSGTVYVAGGTASGDFPVKAGAYDPTYNTNADTFIFCLSADGSSLVYSTFLGGAATESLSGLALDSSNSVYVTGSTGSTDFPTSAGAYDTTLSTPPDAYISKLSADLSTLIYSTYLGGSNSAGQTETTLDIAVDSSGCAYVTGDTCSATDFPTTAGALRTTHNGVYDAFVTKLNSTGTALTYSTFLGGMTGRNEGFSILVDSSGCAFVTGRTFALDFPIAPGAYDWVYSGVGNAYVAKLNSNGTSVTNSTFLSGTAGGEAGCSVALDSAGSVLVTGTTPTTDFPTTIDAYDRSQNGSTDIFVTKFDKYLSNVEYSTYLGGASSETPLRIVVDSSDRAYVAGGTSSSNFPTTTGAYDTSYNTGWADAIVAKIQFSTPSAVSTIKAMGDNSSVTRTRGIVTYASGTVFYVEAEDRSCGIRADEPSGLIPSVGDRVEVAGSVKTNTDDERYVDVTGWFRNGTAGIAPVFVNNLNVGGADWNYNAASGAGQRGVKDNATTYSSAANNVGLLLTTTGQVGGVGTNEFFIDDGANQVDEAGNVGVRIYAPGLTLPPSGRQVRITGISSLRKALSGDLYRVILVRGQSDIVRLN